jgi:hypothetical protein
MFSFKIAVFTEVPITATDPLVIAVEAMRQVPDHHTIVLLDFLVTRSAFFATSALVPV